MTEPAPAASAGQRVDRWLWFARIFKSRSLAAKAVEGGAVRITRSGQTIRTDKPSYGLKVGDVVTLKVRGLVRVVEVLGSGERRGPARQAQSLYRDLTAPAQAIPDEPSASAPEPHSGGRPGRRARRALDRLKGRDQLNGE